MAEAKKTAAPSILDNIKASLGITLLTLTIVAFVLILILGLIFDGGSDLIIVFLALAAFSALMGLASRLLADGKAALWLAVIFGGVGSIVLLTYGASTGGGAETPFGHAIMGALGEDPISGGAVLGAIIAVIVAKWSDK